MPASLVPDDFFAAPHAEVFAACRALADRGIEVDEITLSEELRRAGTFERVGGSVLLIELVQSVEVSANFDQWVRMVKEDSAKRRILRESMRLVTLIQYGGADTAAIAQRIAQMQHNGEQLRGSAKDLILQEAYRCRFDFDHPVPRPEPRVLIGGKVICTPGNLTCITSRAKAGKSAFLGAMQAAAICAEYGLTDADTLGVTTGKPGGRCFLRIETEQSHYAVQPAGIAPGRH